MIKKLMVFLMVTVILLSIFTGCAKDNTREPADNTVGQDQNTNPEPEAEKDKGEEEGGNLNPVGELPIVKDKITISAFITTRPAVDDYENNDFTKWLEEQTNIHVDWKVVPEADSSEKINLMLSGGDYPDVFLCPFFTNEQLILYGNQGIFKPLDELIETYGVNTKQVFEQYPHIKKDIILDGHIYSLPYINECFHCTMDQKMWIYQPWLDKLDIEMPQTTDDFYEVLKAFKERDPNGNGKPDEIPLVGAEGGWSTNIDGFLMNSFIYNDSGNRIIVDNEKVDVVYNKEEWRGGLRYIRKLYQEGLIAPETFTQDGAQLKQLGENPDAVIMGAAPAGYFGTITQYQGDSGRWEEYKSVPPLKGPNGVQYSRFTPVTASAGFTITDKCENPEAAMRWADYMYEQDVVLRGIFGREGTDWEYAKEGDVGINGKPAIYKVISGVGGQETPKNIHWDQRALSCRTADFRLGEMIDPENPLEAILYEETKNNYEPYIPSTDMLLPKITFTEAQSAELVDLRTVINEYVKESTAKFIVGGMDLDKDWDSYLEQLEKMNLKHYLEVYQEAYDTYMAQ